ncbi:MAG: hypothetical protein HC781_04470 [Leptolyngbyaceae cyanobacterium CSU_1_4]|nr:hypothetical protein [Leptolyngbyaceae cyanobacterium CSU_1_4]
MKTSLAPVWINFWFWSGLSSVTLAICGSALLPPPAAAQAVQNLLPASVEGQSSIQNSIIDVGVVQRFGSETTDVITLKPVEGDRFTLKFVDQGVPKKLVTANEVTLNVTLQPLPQRRSKSGLF